METMSEAMLQPWATFAAQYSEGRRAWVAAVAPEGFEPVNLAARAGFRAHPAETAQFDSVWIVDAAIDCQGWRILLDSAIRLLKKNGMLALRYRQDRYTSVINIKNFLFRKFGITAEVIDEKLHDQEFLTVFGITRTHLPAADDRSWTFGLLTQGMKPDVVSRFCKSVRDHGGGDHEIIIVGPEDASNSNYHVRYIGTEYSDRFSDICRKKNDIISSSTHENICILHDRYWLNEDFFVGFDEYGYDFDFLTVQQYHESGKIYPSLCAIDSKYNLLWGNIFDCGNDNETWTGQYINGGLIIGKKSLFEVVPFNDLIFHNQAEDVEISAQMASHSVVARINRNSSTTTAVDDRLTGVFAYSPETDYHRILFPDPSAVSDPLADIGQRFSTLIGISCDIEGRRGFRQPRPGNGILLYGPYVGLTPGVYEIDVLVARVAEGAVDNDSFLYFDIVGDHLGITFLSEELRLDPGTSTLSVARRIVVEHPVDNFEVRAHVTDHGQWAITIPRVTRISAPEDDLRLFDEGYSSLIGGEHRAYGRPAFRQRDGQNGILLFGPYATLREGAYEISMVVQCEPDDRHAQVQPKLLLDVVGEDLDVTLLSEDFTATDGANPLLIVRKIVADRQIDRVEIRAHASGGGTWTVTWPVVRILDAN